MHTSDTKLRNYLGRKQTSIIGTYMFIVHVHEIQLSMFKHEVPHMKLPSCLNEPPLSLTLIQYIQEIRLSREAQFAL
jgi:hypothetical protein